MEDHLQGRRSLGRVSITACRGALWRSVDRGALQIHGRFSHLNFARRKALKIKGFFNARDFLIFARSVQSWTRDYSREIDPTLI